MNNASGGTMVQSAWAAAGASSGKGLSMLSPLSLSLSLSGKHVDRWWLEVLSLLALLVQTYKY
jgi:hypothetical protein